MPINSALLDGSGSADPDNNISSFSWKKISGPVSAQIVSPGSIKTFVNELVQGDYQFELKVTDSTNLISRDTVNIKVATGPTPPSTSKTVRASIIEHGTNIPVAGAVLFICTSPIDYFRCAANYLTVVTDANGFANFKADSFRYSHVEAAGYWQNIFEPCFVSYFRNKTLLVNNFYSADSLVIKVVPKNSVLVHIRDSSLRASGENISLVGDVDFNCVSSHSILGAILRPGIDTTIAMPNLYGNADYILSIGRNYDSDCHCFYTEYYRQIIHVPKGSPAVLNITY